MRILLLLLISLQGWAASETSIRVRLLKAQTALVLSGTDLKFESRQGFLREVGEVRGRVQIQKKGAVWVLKGSSWARRLAADRIVFRGQGLSVAGKKLGTLSEIEILSISGDYMDLVAQVPLEEYLRGVLPSEMPPSWPIEALKAQAVASRSYVLRQVSDRVGREFHVEASISDQVFDPQIRHELGSFAERTAQALKETEGEVLLDPKGEIQRAYFHSDCGGSTETSFFVWRTQESTARVQDVSCPAGPFRNWVYQISLKELEQRLEIKRIEKLVLGQRTQSGRVSTLLIRTKAGAEEMLLSEVFRKKVGFNQIKSTNFVARRAGDMFVFEGQGHGHGVGMCQWGSRALAQQGEDYKKILLHYFPLSQIEVRRKGLFANLGL